ncbi:exodeoxyribonuclease VII large subunit [Candidatus Parcubacteria bacterium]|jgi:exodeoxyribonuclease VII large subunit|nr:MAG: exodeoxyribonuclease VII large subunit [Candidatus Parcubacteria bacterium]
MEYAKNIDKIFSVSEYIEFLNEYLKPTECVVQGEVGEKISKYPNFSFFNLIDTKDKSSIQCFATVSALRTLGGELAPGMEIRVEGRASVFKKNGGLNIQVSRIIPVGEGALKKQFELLRKKLSEEGYFDIERKKKIPRFVSAIGLITSKVGRGAKKDFEINLGSFGFKIVFFPSKVEGVFAVKELVSGIEYLNKEYPMLQVIVITRGGGSWESLQAFNSEELVKAVAASKIPVISAIGHEDDVTLVDYVADIRASTPTHAARMLSEPWARADEQVVRTRKFLQAQMDGHIRQITDTFIRFQKNIPNKISERIQLFLNRISHPLSIASAKMGGMKQQIEYKKALIVLRMKDTVNAHTVKINNFGKTLLLANPGLKLKQGYSISRDRLGKVIKDVGNIKKGDTINTQFSKGSIDTTVINIEQGVIHDRKEI